MFHRFALSLTASILATNLALAQPTDSIWVPADSISYDRKLNDDEITVCLNKASALVELDRQVAQAIADTLLLNVRFEELVSPYLPYKFDFRIPFASTDLFVQVTNKCQALMGVRLSPGQMPTWMTVSAPYYKTRSVLAVMDAGVTSIAQIAPGQDIGSRLGAPGDTQLTSYLRSLPADTRPRRVPYPNNEVLLDKIGQGDLKAAFIWEPALHLASEGDPSSLGVLGTFDPPFTATPVEFAIAFPVQDTFLRGLFDEALQALISDGEVDAIVATFPIPSNLAP